MAEPVRANDAPLVSVAMATLNAERTLPAAVASLLMQTHARWELIMIDDGSSDGSVQAVRRFADPRIRVLADGAHRGLAARLNQAVGLAQGDLLARMDQDDVCYPERFARQVAFLQANPAVNLVGSTALVFEGEGRPVGLLRARENHADICARPWAGFYLPHPTWMGRTAWFRANPYNERNVRSEDQELLLRTHETSRFAALPEPLLGYRQDRVELRKVLHSRYSFSRALLRRSAARRAPALALRGVGGQLAKAAFDTLAISTGTERRLLAHRARPLPAGAAERWRDVWRLAAAAAAKH